MYDSDETAEPTAQVEVSEQDEALLREIRDKYKYYLDSWEEARRERRIDMRYICGHPWDPKDERERAENGRPCINHDELNQYVNQAVNDVRKNKRGIKVEPAGEGATDKTAEYRQNRIRAIEYRSQAQGAYCNGYQAQLEGSYGFWRVTHDFIPGTWNQEIWIRTIPNPDSVLYDPDCKEPDWSDAKGCFVVEPMAIDDFKRQFPKARRTDFAADDMRVASDWIRDKQVLVAEYWCVEIEDRTLYELDNGKCVYELPKGQKAKRQRKDNKKKVVNYKTNGVEILERTEQPGTEIPIIPCMGLVRYVDDGGGTKRIINSMVRLARDPQMTLAYIASGEVEETGLIPKVPYIGYTGQFETDKDAWDTITTKNHPYVQVDPSPEGANGALLPHPVRQPLTPNFAGWEVGKEAARRAIQAAMGISPLPTAAQRQNEKSGIALDRIRQSEAQGSYHFVDNYERAIARTGRVIESWLAVVDDYEGTVPMRLPDDSHKLARINTAEPYKDEKTGGMEHYPVTEAPHDETVSVGPSNESQREAAGEFLDILISNLGTLPIAPPQAAKLLALAIQMKQLGPKGDQMADIISPDEQGQQVPPEAQQAIAQAQQHLQAINEYAKGLESQVQQLTQEKDAKVIDNQARIKIEQMKIDFENRKLETDLAKAEIMTKAQISSEREALVQDVMKQVMAQFHERDMQDQQQAHEQQQAAQATQAQSQMADQQAANQSVLQQQQAEQAQAQQSQQDQAA